MDPKRGSLKISWERQVLPPSVVISRNGSCGSGPKERPLVQPVSTSTNCMWSRPAPRTRSWTSRQVWPLSSLPSSTGRGVRPRAAHALVDLAPGLAVIVAAQQHGVERGGGGVDIARGENSEPRRVHSGQLQVDRAGVLLRAPKSSQANVFLGAMERRHHGLAGVLQYRGRGRRYGGHRGRGQVLRPEDSACQQE